MSNKKVVIRFKNIHKLWDFAQKLEAKNIQIITSSMILICRCVDADLSLILQFQGEVVEEYIPEDDTHFAEQNFIKNIN